MAAINVLVVGDGPYSVQTPHPMNGINFLPSQDLTDNTFTISEFIYLLRNNPVPSISVDTAHRRIDPNATFQNFIFTSAALAPYDVLWLFGYEGWNYGTVPYGSAIGPDEVAAIANFMKSGGGVFAVGDHAGMGSLMCGQIPRVRSMRNWFGRASDIPAGCPTTAIDYSGATVSAVNRPGESGNPVPGVARADTLQANPSDSATPGQFQFDDQSDAIPQTLTFVPAEPPHSILQGPNGPINRYPDHMHEGEVVTPSSLSETVTIGGQSFVEYPAIGSYQPVPGIIATGNIVAGHTTLVEGASCEINNFTTDNTPTVATTIGILCVYDGRGVGVGRVVTDSSFHHYLDLNLIGDPCGSSPDRTQGFAGGLVDANHDPVTPASGSVLADLQAFYVSTVVWLARFNQDFYFSVDKSTFGVDEASDNNTFPNFPDSFWLVVNGYSPDAVQASLGSLHLAGPFANISGISLTAGSLQLEGSIPSNQAQRVLIPYSVQFSGSSISAFPTAGNPAIQMPLQATITIGGISYGPETEFELGSGQDPYFQNINPQEDNAFYLSQDICVFTATPGTNTTPVASAPVQFTAGPNKYIKDLLTYLNSQTAFTIPQTTDPFNSFPSQVLTDGDSSVTPGTSALPNYNFAIARVRLNGPLNSKAKNVKVFFRLFITQTSDTDYQPNGTYLSKLDASNLPKTPLPAPDNETTPFFASSTSAADYATGGPNNRDITITNSNGAWAYFGCYLDVYNPAINLQMYGTHHCIVAQIAYDDAPIVNSNGLTAGPDNSDKLAQRNMEVSFTHNPGSPPSRRVPQTFDLRPGPAISPVAGQLLDYPDELMIDWGNVPHGSIATIYWPQADGSDVLRMASQLYAANQLTLADPHTVQCPVNGGFTYVPIPSGTGQNFGGLFTIDLSPALKKGQEFNIVVRRLSSRQLSDVNVAANARTAQAVGRPGSAKVQRNWRYVIGTFQVKIPVDSAKAILPSEENTYAILLWRFSQMSPGNRWYPVILRYLSYIAARVNALGGNASGIKPSPWGAGTSSGGVQPEPIPIGLDTEEFTGKVVGVVYDRFGDFEGFLLITESGHEHAFRAREAEIEALVRFAWMDRVVISVLVHKGHPELPVSIILRRAPRPEH